MPVSISGGSLAVYPGLITIDPALYTEVVDGTASRTTFTWQGGGALITGNDDDTKVRYKFLLTSSGTYTFVMGVTKGTNQAIITIDLDSSNIGTYDAYNNGDTTGIKEIDSIPLAAGYHTLDLSTPTKNAAAGEYCAFVSFLGFIKTA